MKATLTLERKQSKPLKSKPLPESNLTERSSIAKKRIFIVDDHAIVRDGLTQLLNGEADLCVCGEADNAQDFLSAIPDAKPDAAIVDIGLPTMNGVELIKHVKAQYPQLPILALSMYEENLYAERVLRAGARGYLMKQHGTTSLCTALRDILSGRIHVSDKMNAKMLNSFSSNNPGGGSLEDCLSDRELEVFELLGQGLGTRQRVGDKFLG
jgi:DNA-binding NarL/FixJ family response regulator